MEALLLTYSLSGAAGMRSSLTLLVTALSVHFGYLHPDPTLSWVGSWWLIALACGGATTEFFADKIPVVDHAMHAVHFALAPIVGAITGMTGYHGDSTLEVVLGVLGGGNAFFLHTARTTLRTASSVTTLGIANPIVSLIEDVLAAAFIIVAIMAPVLTALTLVLATIWVTKAIKRTVVA